MVFWLPTLFKLVKMTILLLVIIIILLVIVWLTRIQLLLNCALVMVEVQKLIMLVVRVWFWGKSTMRCWWLLVSTIKIVVFMKWWWMLVKLVTMMLTMKFTWRITKVISMVILVTIVMIISMLDIKLFQLAGIILFHWSNFNVV